MPVAPVFLDTACLLALIRPLDALHEPATIVLKQLERRRTPLITSDWVLVEFLNAASPPALRLRAAQLVQITLADRNAEVVAADRKGLIEAIEYYRSRPDKGWSLVDCASILICQSRGISTIFTHDHHFRQAGFETLL